MKKLVDGIKRILAMIGALFTLVHSKVFAASMLPIEEMETLYGVMEPTPVTILRRLWGVARTILIPIVLIIGTIVYFKKSTSSVKKKIITILIAVIIVVLICFGITAILNGVI